MAAGSIRAAIIVGEDPVSGAADAEKVRESLEKLDFLMVADTIPTETTALADVILPLSAPGETCGSFTSRSCTCSYSGASFGLFTRYSPEIWRTSNSLSA